jgi:hypothetical protein
MLMTYLVQEHIPIAPRRNARPRHVPPDAVDLPFERAEIYVAHMPR